MPQKSTILITGASSGIAKATALCFGQNGYRVFATYRREEDAGMLREFENVHPVRMDVTCGPDIHNAFQQVSDILGGDGVYAIINNAGITYTVPFEPADEKRARQVVEVNVMAPYKITQTFIPLLKKNSARHASKARVVDIASRAG